MTLNDDYNLQSIVANAPIGICILNAQTLFVETVNDKFLEIAGKPRGAILNKWYWEPFQEARPYYESALANVVSSGEPFYANEVELMLVRDGKEEWVFVTFVYMPVRDKSGKLTKVCIWVLENTQQVRSRKMIESLNEELVLQTKNKQL